VTTSYPVRAADVEAQNGRQHAEQRRLSDPLRPVSITRTPEARA
jgi:hypothetical protein